MNRLAYVIASTRQFAAMRDFYHEGIGVELRRVEDEARAEFDTAGTTFVIEAAEDPARVGLVLGFETGDLEDARATLAARGVSFDGGVVTMPRGRRANLRDPDGNAITLWEPAAPVPSGLGPAMGSVIVNARDFGAVVAFYRDVLGLEVSREDEHWVEFDTGLTRLAVHARPADRAHPRHAEPPVAWTFETDDVTAWADAIRGRRLRFLSAPITEDFGTYAELADPDGNIVVLREPPPEPTLEERLAEPFEDEEAPRRAAIRKPITKGTQAISRLVNKPGYRTKKKAAKRAAVEAKPAKVAKAAKKRAAMPSARGSGPSRTRVKPKTTRDTRKAKAKPAHGRLKKAQRKGAAQKRRATATASRGRPVKRAATRGARGRAKGGRGGRR